MKSNTTTTGYSGELTSYNSDFTVTVPKPLGYWDIGGSRFSVYYNTPSSFHRKMVKWFFGWEYIPSSNTTTRQMLHG